MHNNFTSQTKDQIKDKIQPGYPMQHWQAELCPMVKYAHDKENWAEHLKTTERALRGTRTHHNYPEVGEEEPCQETSLFGACLSTREKKQMSIEVLK